MNMKQFPVSPDGVRGLPSGWRQRTFLNKSGKASCHFYSPEGIMFDTKSAVQQAIQVEISLCKSKRGPPKNRGSPRNAFKSKNNDNNVIAKSRPNSQKKSTNLIRRSRSTMSVVKSANLVSESSIQAGSSSKHPQCSKKLEFEKETRRNTSMRCLGTKTNSSNLTDKAITRPNTKRAASRNSPRIQGGTRVRSISLRDKQRKEEQMESTDTVSKNDNSKKTPNNRTSATRSHSYNINSLSQCNRSMSMEKDKNGLKKSSSQINSGRKTMTSVNKVHKQRRRCSIRRQNFNRRASLRRHDDSKKTEVRHLSVIQTSSVTPKSKRNDGKNSDGRTLLKNITPKTEMVGETTPRPDGFKRISRNELSALFENTIIDRGRQRITLKSSEKSTLKPDKSDVKSTRSATKSDMNSAAEGEYYCFMCQKVTELVKYEISCCHDLRCFLCDFNCTSVITYTEHMMKHGTAFLSPNTDSMACKCGYKSENGSIMATHLISNCKTEGCNVSKQDKVMRSLRCKTREDHGSKLLKSCKRFAETTGPVPKLCRLSMESTEKRRKSLSQNSDSGNSSSDDEGPCRVTRSRQIESHEVLETGLRDEHFKRPVSAASIKANKLRTRSLNTARHGSKRKDKTTSVHSDSRKQKREDQFDSEGEGSLMVTRRRTAGQLNASNVLNSTIVKAEIVRCADSAAVSDSSELITSRFTSPRAQYVDGSAKDGTQDVVRKMSGDKSQKVLKTKIINVSNINYENSPRKTRPSVSSKESENKDKYNDSQTVSNPKNVDDSDSEKNSSDEESEEDTSIHTRRTRASKNCESKSTTRVTIKQSSACDIWSARLNGCDSKPSSFTQVKKRKVSRGKDMAIIESHERELEQLERERELAGESKSQSPPPIIPPQPILDPVIIPPAEYAFSPEPSPDKKDGNMSLATSHLDLSLPVGESFGDDNIGQLVEDILDRMNTSDKNNDSSNDQSMTEYNLSPIKTKEIRKEEKMHVLKHSVDNAVLVKQISVDSQSSLISKYNESYPDNIAPSDSPVDMCYRRADHALPNSLINNTLSENIHSRLVRVTNVLSQSHEDGLKKSAAMVTSPVTQMTPVCQSPVHQLSSVSHSPIHQSVAQSPTPGATQSPAHSIVVQSPIHQNIVQSPLHHAVAQSPTNTSLAPVSQSPVYHTNSLSQLPVYPTITSAKSPVHPSNSIDQSPLHQSVNGMAYPHPTPIYHVPARQPTPVNQPTENSPIINVDSPLQPDSIKHGVSIDGTDGSSPADVHVSTEVVPKNSTTLEKKIQIDKRSKDGIESAIKEYATARTSEKSDDISAAKSKSTPSIQVNVYNIQSESNTANLYPHHAHDSRLEPSSPHSITSATLSYYKAHSLPHVGSHAAPSHVPPHAHVQPSPSNHFPSHSHYYPYPPPDVQNYQRKPDVSHTKQHAALPSSKSKYSAPTKPVEHPTKEVAQVSQSSSRSSTPCYDHTDRSSDLPLRYIASRPSSAYDPQTVIRHDESSSQMFALQSLMHSQGPPPAYSTGYGAHHLPPPGSFIDPALHIYGSSPYIPPHAGYHRPPTAYPSHPSYIQEALPSYNLAAYKSSHHLPTSTEPATSSYREAIKDTVSPPFRISVPSVSPYTSAIKSEPTSSSYHCRVCSKNFKSDLDLTKHKDFEHKSVNSKNTSQPTSTKTQKFPFHW